MCIHLCVCVRVCLMIVGVRGQNRAGGFLELELKAAPWPKCQDPNSRFLDEQKVLLAAETSRWSMRCSEGLGEGAAALQWIEAFTCLSCLLDSLSPDLSQALPAPQTQPHCPDEAQSSFSLWCREFFQGLLMAYSSGQVPANSILNETQNMMSNYGNCSPTCSLKTEELVNLGQLPPFQSCPKWGFLTVHLNITLETLKYANSWVLLALGGKTQKRCFNLCFLKVYR